MTAAYNLWAFLRYDANCEHPAFVPPTEEDFEFWTANVPFLEAQGISAVVWASGHLCYPVGWKNRLHRQEQEYVAAHGAALHTACRSKRTQIQDTGGGRAARAYDTVFGHVLRHGSRLHDRRRNRSKRGRIDTRLPPAAQLSDTHGGKLAEVHHQFHRPHNYIIWPTGKGQQRLTLLPLLFVPWYSVTSAAVNHILIKTLFCFAIWIISSSRKLFK